MDDALSGPAVRFVGVSLDCADPAALAEFYLTLLGGELLWQSADSAAVRVSSVVLAMQRVAPYRPPAWPGSSVLHLDLAPGADADLESAAARAVEAGAVRADHQPDPRWRVLVDPAGHPFCITTVTPPPDTSVA